MIPQSKLRRDQHSLIFRSFAFLQALDFLSVSTGSALSTLGKRRLSRCYRLCQVYFGAKVQCSAYSPTTAGNNVPVQRCMWWDMHSPYVQSSPDVQSGASCPYLVLPRDPESGWLQRKLRTRTLKTRCPTVVIQPSSGEADSRT